MDVRRIRRLAKVIEAQPKSQFWDKEGFDMDRWTHACGSPSCIAGWAWSLAGSPADKSEWDTAQEYLGLSVPQAGDLFLGAGRPMGMKLTDITPTHAAAVLRHLADTGDVDWTVVPEART